MRFTSSIFQALERAVLASSIALSCFSIFGSQRANADDTPSTVSMVSRPGYSTTAFDTSVQKLPASFQGNDPAVTYVNIAHNTEATKGEFETTQQFNDRIAAAKTSPITGNLTLNSVYAFQVDPSFVTASYDADKDQLTVNLKFVQPIGGFDSGDVDAIQLSLLETGKRSYTATNGFGAEFQVAKATDNSINLFTTNRKDYHLKWDQHTPGFWYNFSFPMAVDIAQVAKPNMAVLAVCHLVQVKGHYVAAYQHQTTPTADSPFDLNMYDDYIAVKLNQIWIYNSDTGEVYQRIMPKSKN